MHVNDRPTSDLHALARGGDDAPAAGAVPPPRFDWKTRLLLPGAVLLTLALLVGYTAQDALFPPRGVEVVPVVLKSVAGGATTMPSGVSTGSTSPAIGATIQAPGWVEPDPYPIAATALAGGVVEDVLALEGQPVKAGDIVARLVDDDAKLALARAQADLAQKQATLDAAQRQWDNPIERTRAVAVGDAMVAQTRAHIEKHHAEVAVQRAKLAQAREEHDRVQASAQSRAVSEIEVIRAKQSLEAQTATLKATEAERAIFEADLAQRIAELDAAKENLRLRIEDAQALAETKAAVALAQATRDEAALRLARMEVRSPADGIVMQRLVEPGSKLLLDMDDPRSAQAVRLYNPKKLQVRVDIPLSDAARVGVGMDAQIVVGVLPERTFRGKVTRIVNEADIQKNTLQVKVSIADPSHELKPEMLARVRFSGSRVLEVNGSAQPQASGGAGAGTSIAGQVIFAPLALIQRHDGGDATAWVFDPRRGVAVHKSIVLGAHQQHGWIAVTAGLSPGDQLIVADGDDLTDGQRVRVIGEADPSSLHARNDEEGSDHGAH